MGHKPVNTPAKELAYACGRARRQWGQEGWAWHPAREVKGGIGYCCVGVRPDGATHEGQWEVYGIGSTFAEAFADAQARGH